MSNLIGLVGGTVFYEQDYFSQAEQKDIETEFGRAMVLIAGDLAYIPRHGLSDGPYVLPHQINHTANLAALKSLGVSEIIGISSSGSLMPSILPGTIVLPSDYISLNDPITSVTTEPMHITPVLDADVRRKLLRAAEIAGAVVTEGGVYWQSLGPRLETKAEIKMMADYAHVVGMTMASEATVSQEMGMKYASLCTVDNYAHGLSNQPLTEDEIRRNAASSSQTVFKIIEAYLTL